MTPNVDGALVKLLTNKHSNCIMDTQLSDTSYVCRADIVAWRQPDEACLVSYLATGNIQVHSLPKLRPLLDTDFVPYSSARVADSMRLSRNGHCLYQPSASVICKFTLNAQYKSLINEMTGSLYVPRDMPEMPRANFFKSLLSSVAGAATGVGSSGKQSERDELFGVDAGKSLHGVAKIVAGATGHPNASGAAAGDKASGGAAASASGFDKLRGAAQGTMAHDMRVAREGLDERGEKLSEIEDKTLQMLNSSESYAQAAHQLAQKFKDKKWYQF